MTQHHSLLTHLALGAAAGLAGTLALQAIRTSTEKLAPSTSPPIGKDPGEFMLQQAKSPLPPRLRAKIPASLESAAAKSLGLAYGMTFGALYAALRPAGGPRFSDGVALGLATWAAGYLGWLPATKLMTPITRQSLPQAVTPAAQHAAFGIATVAAYDYLHAHA